MPIKKDFESFIDRLPVGVCRLDRRLEHIFLNHRFAEFLGVSRTEGGISTVAAAGLPKDLSQPLLDAAMRVIDSGEHVETEFPLKTPRGPRLIRMRLEPEKDERGEVTHVAGAGFDITEPHRLEAALRQSEARFKAFMAYTPAIAWIKDEQGRYLYANPYYETHFGISDWKGRTDFDLFSEDFARACREKEFEVLRSGKPAETIGPATDRDGTVRQWSLIRFPFRDDSGTQYIGGVAIDVTERRMVEQRVRLESVMDDLTGLYNRRGFIERAEQEYGRAQELKHPCAIFYVDVDGLKDINDTLGHEVGDDALIAVSEILRISFRNSDVLGRLGGDEFAVLAVDCRMEDLLYERLLANIEAHNAAHRAPYELALSIGYLPVETKEELTLDEALARADEKMYADKRARQQG